jgi:hypothetical protein
MGILKSEIFIASNFKEFSPLRARLRALIDSSRLPIQALDLDRNEPSGRPPLSISLEAAKRSEVMVLLVGEEYGGSPPGKKHSYTHLEYRAAKEEPGITILPYFVGPCYREKLRTPSPHALLAAWQAEITRNHTAAFFASVDDPELAVIIFKEVEKAIYDRLSEADQAQVDFADSDDEDLGSLDRESLSEEELTYLERRSGDESAATFAAQDGESRKALDVLLRPAEAAAGEQRREAEKAMELRDWATAILHFKRALGHRPLDAYSSYWLARLLVVSGRKKECREALALAERAERMAAHEGRDVRRAAALIVAAQAAARLEDSDRGLLFAQQAVEAASWFAATHIELACQYARRQQLDPAFAEAREAFNRHPASILKLNREPVLQRHPARFREFKRSLRVEVRDRVEAILRTQLRLLALSREWAAVDVPTATAADGPSVPAFLASLDAGGAGGADQVASADRAAEVANRLVVLPSMGILDLVHEGRRAAQRNLALLRVIAARLKDDAAVVHGLPARVEATRAQLRGPTAADRRSRVVRPPMLDRALRIGRVLGIAIILLNLIRAANPDRFQSSIAALVLGGATAVGCVIFRRRLAEVQRRRGIEQDVARLSTDLEQRRTVHRARLLDFVERVRDFEMSTIRWRIFSPSTGLVLARRGSLIRVDVNDRARRDDLALDASPLPAALFPAGEEMRTAENEPRYQLFRIIDATDVMKTAARWGCYFR